MAVRTPPSSRSGAREDAVPRSAALPASAVLAVSLPFLFLHVDYQPGFTVGLGGPSADVYLSDFAVLAVAIAGLVAGVRHGFAPLRAGWPIWVTGGLFLAMVGAASAYPRIWDGSYAWSTHAVTAGKFAEYAALALAVPLLLRAPRDLELVLVSLGSWTAVAATVGVVQFFGVDIFDAWQAGRRQPSFLGHYDLAAMSGASLAVALAWIALGQSHRAHRGFIVLTAAAGAVGVIVSGSSAAGIGVGAAAAAVLGVALFRRRLTAGRTAASLAIVGIVALGIVTLRGNDFDQFLRFLGVRSEEKAAQANVQTYVQRTLLAYIGWRIFLDHPVLGAGWQASEKERTTYGPYLADAHREFPGAPELAFPSPAHPWGIQNGYIQAMADLGAIGLALFLGVFAAGLWIVGRAVLRAPPLGIAPPLLGGLWLLVAMGVWTAVGLVAGIPLDGLTWLSLGLAAASAAWALHEPE